MEDVVMEREAAMQTTPSRSQLPDSCPTPRRSARKSIKMFSDIQLPKRIVQEGTGRKKTKRGRRGKLNVEDISEEEVCPSMDVDSEEKETELEIGAISETDCEETGQQIAENKLQLESCKLPSVDIIESNETDENTEKISKKSKRGRKGKKNKKNLQKIAEEVVTVESDSDGTKQEQEKPQINIESSQTFSDENIKSVPGESKEEELFQNDDISVVIVQDGNENKEIELMESDSSKNEDEALPERDQRKEETNQLENCQLPSVEIIEPVADCQELVEGLPNDGVPTSVEIETTIKDRKLDESVIDVDALDTSDMGIGLLTPLNSKKVEKLPTSTLIMRSLEAVLTPECDKKKSMPSHPTPFKPSTPIDISADENIENDENQPFVNIFSQQVETRFVDNTNKKRQRSVSVSEKPKNRVTFYSPANTAIPIDQIDDIMKSSKKAATYITERRKRSLSVAETEDEKGLVFAVHNGGNKLKTGTPGGVSKSAGKRKMPNFAAIHANYFEKLESLTDHVNRKNNRAKLLSASKVKMQGSTAEKIITHRNLNLHKSHLPVPKARQRINLNNITMEPMNKTISKSEPALNTTDFSQIAAKINTNLFSLKGTAPARKEAPATKSRDKSRMDMYKGRSVRKAALATGSDKTREIIKGVRSNRRFELQMMCRNRANENN